MTAVDAPGLSYSSAAGRWVLAVSVLGSGIAVLDATVVNIALPTIGRRRYTRAVLHCGLEAPPLAASRDRRTLAIQPRG
jgi:hypothetical protein